MTYTYWIQNSDLSIAEEGEVSSPEHARSLYDNHDWPTQLKILADLLLQADKDDCPPGIGFVREMNVFLHLCPNGDGTVLSSCCLWGNVKILGLFKSKRIVLHEASAMPDVVAHTAIRKFFAGEDDWLVNCFKEVNGDQNE